MRKLVTISLPWEMHERLFRRVSTADVSVSEYIRELIRKDLGRNRSEPLVSTPIPAEESQPIFVIKTFNELIAEAYEAKAD